MAALATPISEDWIRERVGLDHENLGKERSCFEIEVKFFYMFYKFFI